jgi:hypothetical protein
MFDAIDRGEQDACSIDGKINMTSLKIEKNMTQTQQ